MLVRPLPPTVDLFALARAYPQRYPHLLESALLGQAPARYSLLFAFPGTTVTGDVAAALATMAQQPLGLASDADVALAHELPFIGGWFFFLGYEAAWALEPALGACAADPWLPTVVLTYFPAALIVDHQQHRAFWVQETTDNAWFAQVEQDIQAVQQQAPVALDLPALTLTEDPPKDYLHAVERCLRYIRDGDCFQANLSRQWQVVAAASVSTDTLYARLRRANPAPFAAWLRLPGAEVLSSSPERLVAVVDGVIETRPIAGTRRRDPTTQRDTALSQELKAHPKEIAEHIMLVDLERNDLGRLAVTGSVQVSELMTIESYTRVHHIVSVIQARLCPQATAADILQATFPGGTITGCPKIRSMQVIQELEGGVARGAYTGTCGYLSRHGRMDSNILIRSLVVRGATVRFRTGAGIVADSVPERELAETRYKAQALLEALD